MYNSSLNLPELFIEALRIKDIEIKKLKQKLAEYRLEENTFELPKCNFRYIFQTEPCSEIMKPDPHYKPSDGYCCKSPCEEHYVLFNSFDDVPADIDRAEQCYTLEIMTGVCCDPL